MDSVGSLHASMAPNQRTQGGGNRRKHETTQVLLCLYTDGLFCAWKHGVKKESGCSEHVQARGNALHNKEHKQNVKSGYIRVVRAETRGQPPGDAVITAVPA